MEEKKYGLVLAGGGAKGAYEIGALKAIDELDLTDKICAVAGNSIGSVNSALFSQKNIANAEKIWSNIDPDDFLDFDDNGFNITKEGDGIFSREGLLRIINSNVDFDKMSNSETDYYITVCEKKPDGSVGVKYIKQNGKDKETISKYILASSAIPVVYDAVSVEDGFYFDGGMLDNTPIQPLYDAGIKNIIVISNDYLYKPDLAKYPDADIICVVPSSSLDVNGIYGTADLSNSHARYRLTLGYYDAKAILSAYLDNRKVPDISGNHILAMQDLKKTKLDTLVKNDMDGLARIIGDYNLL